MLGDQIHTVEWMSIILPNRASHTNHKTTERHKAPSLWHHDSHSTVCTSAHTHTFKQKSSSTKTFSIIHSECMQQFQRTSLTWDWLVISIPNSPGRPRQQIQCVCVKINTVGEQTSNNIISSNGAQSNVPRSVSYIYLSYIHTHVDVDTHSHKIAFTQ